MDRIEGHASDALSTGISIFDLDGTLWEENSHTNIVDQYYHTSFFESLLGKLVYRLSPALFMNMLARKYALIPDDYFENYNPTLRQDAVQRLIEDQRAGMDVMIITNAPEKIAAIARRKFHVPVYCAATGEKGNKLNEIRRDVGTLKVATDNLSDRALLERASAATIYTKRKRLRKFQSFKLPAQTEFILIK